MSQKSKQSELPKSPKSSTPDQNDPKVAILKNLEEYLGHVLESHSLGNGAGEDDVRVRWNVEVVRGKSNVFAKISGVTTMPELLADSQLHLAPERIMDELINKACLPTANKFQEYANTRALETSDDKKVRNNYISDGMSLDDSPFSDYDVAVEAEVISDTQ